MKNNADTKDKTKQAKKELLAELESRLDELSGIAQSPIEELFLLSFLSICDYYYLDPTCYDGGGDMIRVNAELYGETIFIIPQEEIGDYRVDFLFVVSEKKLFIVECDGHDFHEKTKEQVARDKSREREFIKDNYTVVRFSGSEIYNNPFKCIGDLEQMFVNYWSKNNG